MPLLLVAFFSENRVTTELLFRPLESSRLMYRENSFMEPVGRERISGNSSPSRRRNTLRRFLQALLLFSPEPCSGIREKQAEPNWFSGQFAHTPPGSPSPMMPSKLPQSGGLLPPVYFVA